MIAARLKSSFDKYFDAPVEAWRQFAGFCELAKFRKNEIIKPEGHRKGMAFSLVV